MTGGTFVYYLYGGVNLDPLLSTPILNPPQTAISRMHKIQETPNGRHGEVKICPKFDVFWRFL